MRLEKKYPIEVSLTLGHILNNDNKYYFLIPNEFNNNEYPILDIGQITIDYFNIDLHEWASIIENCKGKNFTEFLVNITEACEKKFNFILAILLCNELILLTNELLDANSYEEFFEKKFHEIPEFYENFLKHYGKIPTEDSSNEEILTGLIVYIGTYKNLYKVFIREFFDNGENALKLINEIFPKSMEVGYTIIPNINIKESTYFFQEVFKINTLNDFMKFDILKIIERKININICKNCGKYFIPRKRSNEKYCNNIYRNGKTCKELSYEFKIDNDDAEKIYRNAYKTQNAKKQRNSHIKDIEKRFKNWCNIAKKEKEKCKSGQISIEELKKWIDDNKNWHKNN